ncbi:MAG TPA: HupE/UreJ family protein [Candidatus Acidoferrum sp.]|nr:HupE/UreJ family protein [Candidatus Acidoferrum sp.]
MKPANRSLHALLAMFVLLLAGTGDARAHDARPVAVNIEEVAPNVFHWSLRVPPTVEADNQPQVVWPANCATQTNAPQAALMECKGGLDDGKFSLRFPQFNPSLASFYRLTRLQGGTVSAMLSPTSPEWTVPPPMTPTRVARDYTLLGIDHIITGYDHLLFVFGLLVIARTPKRILLTVTGFTMSHSITLSLSALGFVHVPIPPVEASIALSIVFLAHEIANRDTGSLAHRYPVAVSFSFGLLHGLGFANALGELGLAKNEAVLSLLFFNVGVEIGQLLFIAVVFALLWLAGKMLRLQPAHWQDGRWRTRSELLASYVIGVPAAFWLIDRVARFGE